jgi:hypothetical protein
MRTIVTRLSGATVASTTLLSVYGVLALAGVIPLCVYSYFRNLGNVAR